MRAAAESLIPLISAVGHETDITLIDFAADKRAPTPSAAAEIAVPVRADLIAQIDNLAGRQFNAWRRRHDAWRTELRAAGRALPSPQSLLAVPWQKLDGLTERLPRALRANAQIHRTQYSSLAGRLTMRTLQQRIVRDRDRLEAMIARARHCVGVLKDRRRERFAALTARLAVGVRSNVEAHRTRVHRERERVDALGERARRAMRTLIDRRTATIGHAGQVLAALSYQGVLTRGFALVRDPAGRPLRTAAAVTAGERLDIEFADGHVGALAEGPRAKPRAEPVPRPRGSRGSGNPGQGSLFGS